MTTPAAALLNLLGYITGSALYAMLLVMVLDPSRAARADGTDHKPDRLPLLTAFLGLAWNLGALAMVGFQGIVLGQWGLPFSVLPLLNAAAFTALGFLPAVVVHSVLQTREGLKSRPAALWMAVIAYTLSAVAGGLQFHQVMVYRFAPSQWALRTLTAGFLALIVALLVYTRRQSGQPPDLGPQIGWKGAGWVLSLAVFAVSALHLSHHEGREFSWWVELIGHHASLPLALAILYQDYRFALADIFLKRALSLMLLVALAFGLYLILAAPLLDRRGVHGEREAMAVGLLLGLWVATALVYPMLRQWVSRFVDVIVLRRADYDAVCAETAQAIAAYESPENVLDDVCLRLSEALTAGKVRWTLVESSESERNAKSPSGPLLPFIQQRKTTRRLKEAALHPQPHIAAVTDFRQRSLVKDYGATNHDVSWRPGITIATVLVPTSEPPQFHSLIGELAGGRRLLSDDLALIESVAVMAARRIDAVRVVHERCVRDLHEQEMHKLATEAELRALRAQINPHFLFNALTTLGYLIQSAPDRALETLMRLTALLRGVLRHSEGEFSTLGEEIDLIESYLEIERARFEDRLRVLIDVPSNLRGLRIPALLIQPLVENSIKHGISPQRAGGEVVILARMAQDNADQAFPDDTLQIWVRDTGAGANEIALEHGRKRGVGLANVEQRIRRHFGDEGLFQIRSAPGVGTTVELGLPASLAVRSTTASGASISPFEARRKQA